MSDINTRGGFVPGFNKNDLFLKLGTVLAYLFLLSSGIYSYINLEGRLGGNWTALCPRSYVFLVWIPVDLLLLAFVVYQFSTLQLLPGIKAVAPQFILASIFHSIYVHVFVWRHYTVAFIFALLLFGTVGSIYFTLKTKYVSGSVADTVCVHLPFSLWLSWTVFLIPFTLSEVVSTGPLTRHAGFWPQVWVALAFFYLAFSSWAFALATRKGDVVGAVFLAIAIWGTYVEHYTHQKYNLPGVYGSAIASFVVADLAIAFCVVRHWVGRDGRISLPVTEA